MQCPKCHQTISDQSQFCSHCGAQVQSASAMDPIHTHIPGLMDPPVIPDGPYVPETETEVKESLAMGFVETFKYCFLNNYLTISGRASRNEFLKFWAIATIITLVGEIIADLDTYFILSKSYGTISTALDIISTVIIIGITIPLVTTCIRRLHDINRTGWWAVLEVIPFVKLLLLFFNLKANEIKVNQYGKPVHYYVLTEEEARQLGCSRNDATKGTIVCFAIIIALLVVKGLL